MLRRLSMMLMVVACVSTMQAQTFSHYVGRFPDAAYVRNSVANYDHQATHEDWNVIYANSGDELRLLYRSTAFYNYVRWYDYETDRKVTGLTTNNAATINTDAVGIVSLNVAATNEPGRYATWTFGGTHRYIACETSSYNDWGGTTMTHEPTLSQRIVYDIRPASEMARLVDASTGSDYMENYDLIAPVNTNILIGPKYAYATFTDGGYSYPNYYYDESAPVKMLPTGASTTWEINGTVYTTEPDAKTLSRNTTYTVKKVVKAAASWQWKSATTEGGAKTSEAPTVTSGQFAQFNSASAGVVYYYLDYSAGVVTTTVETWKTSDQGNSNRRWASQTVNSTSTIPANTYHIAKFTIDYRALSEVGPYAMTDTVFMESAKLLAKQDFNFKNDTDPSHVVTLHSQKFYRKPLSPEESTFGFYDGSATNNGHPKDDCSYWNEYHFVSGGYGYNANVPQFANHYNNGTDASKGFALYADGSQKPGTVFSINFNAELCPGAKMYFSAWVGEYGGGNHAILDFIVLGVDENGNETTLTTFTTGEFSAACGRAWQRILFPLEYNSNIEFDHYCMRVINKAKTTTNNDFFIDDVFVRILPAPFEPIQATSPNECLTEESPLTMYMKLDFGQVLQNVPAGSAANGTTTFYYRWIAKNIMQGQEFGVADHVRSDYYGTTGTQDYGVITVPNNFKTLPSGYTEGTSFADFDAANNQTPTPEIVFIKESGLTQVGSDKNTTRYVAYIATPMTHQASTGSYSDYYTCVVSQDLSTLGVGTSCSNMNGKAVAFGVNIKSSLGGTVAGQEKEVCANYSYDLTYQVKYAILKEGTTSDTEIATSAYVAHWMWGDSTYVDANPDLYGTNFRTIAVAMKAYAKDEANDTQKKLVNRLVQKGLLTLGHVELNSDGTANPDLSDITYVVMPIEGLSELSYTAFPVAAVRKDAPNCELPQTITLKFPKSDVPGKDPDKNVLSFVKNYDEVVPAYVSSRPRRVRVPYMRNNARVSEQNVKLRLSNADHKYRIVGMKLYSTDDADFTAAAKKREAIGVTATGAPELVTGNACSVNFAHLDLLKEGKTYTFIMEYKLDEEANSADVLAGACKDPDDPDHVHVGEAFVTFVIVPELLYLDENADLDASWNDDYNWIFKNTAEGKEYNIAPLPETSVILATGNHILLNPAVSAVQEPENAQKNNLVDPNALPYISYDINYEPYAANNVYVPVGTALPGQQNVNAVGKWTFDMAITPGKWILTAMPIQGVVSGDMFMPDKGESETDVFAVAAINQTVGTYAADRNNNKMYNSLYNQKAIQKDVIAAYNVDITSSTWTFATNSLNTKFGAGYGWALGYAGEATDKTIRLPKVDSEYHFFGANELWHPMTQTADRTNVGKPAFQVNEHGEMTVHLTQNSSSDIFLLGNPTFAYIDLAALKSRNGIEAFYKAGLEAGGRYTLVAAKTENNGEWVASLPAEDAKYLAPMQAVFIKAAAGTELDVVITKDMLYGADGKNEGNYKSAPAGAPLRAAARADEKVIYIAAEAMDFTATASVVESENASNEAAEEDVELYMLDKTKTPFSIFTLAGDKALAINQINDAEIVPFALFSEKDVESVEVSFAGNDDYLGEWDLVDQQSELRESLYNGMSITLMMPTTGSRYYLEHARHYLPGTATGLDEAEATVKAYTEAGQLTVFSDNDMMDFRLYDAAGRLILSEKNAGRMLTAGLNAGAYMIRTNGEVLKVIVK